MKLVLLALILPTISFAQMKGYGRYKIGETLLSKTECNCYYEYQADSSICIATDWDSYVNANNEASDIELYFYQDTLYCIELSPNEVFLTAWRKKYGEGNKWNKGEISANYLSKNTKQSKLDFRRKILLRIEELRLEYKQLTYDVQTDYSMQLASKAKLEMQELDLRNKTIGYNPSRLNIVNNRTLAKERTFKKKYDIDLNKKNVDKLSKKI